MRTRYSLQRGSSARTRPWRLGQLAAATLVAVTACVFAPGTANASSDFDTGTLTQANPVDGRSEALGVCQLLIGPRDFIEAGEFLLEIGDVENGTGAVQQLVGTATQDGSGGFILSADEVEAEDFYQQVLRDQLSRPEAAFSLTGLEVEIFKSEFDRGPQDISCEMRLHGFLVGSGARSPLPIAPRRRLATIAIGSTSSATTLVFAGAGVVFPGVGETDPALATGSAAAAVDRATTQEAGCPMPNFAPVPEQCDSPSCLVTFAGYQWWTEYQYWGSSGGYFYNLDNAWSPKNVTVDEEGLHLFVRVQDVGAGPRYTAAEAVTALNLDGSLAQFGYGTYLVTAKIKTAPTWDAMDPNVAFGAFTYERDKTGTSDNPNREIDLAEVSRWGRVGNDCKNIKILCEGNSQFTLQLWWKQPDQMINRYTIKDSAGQTITLVMEWNDAATPVVFKQFEGVLTLNDDLSRPAYTWTSDAALNKFIPGANCEQFHLNFWMGNAPAKVDGYNPPPASPQELVVTNFQFCKKGTCPTKS